MSDSIDLSGPIDVIPFDYSQLDIGPSSKTVRNCLIENLAMTYRRNGLSYEDIGIRMKITTEQAATAVRKGLKRYRHESAEAVKDVQIIELQRLDDLMAIAMGRAKGNDGRGVADPRYIDKVLAIMERKAKMQGLDSATKSEVTITASHEDSLAMLE